MAWLILCIAGAFEVGWAAALPWTDGFKRPVPTAVFIACLAGSTYFLEFASRSIPLATAYAVWVGIGVVGITIVGIVARGEPATAVRCGLLVLLTASIIALKLTSPG